jgi:hypothetical protein
MRPEERDYIKRRLSRAEEALREAELLMNSGYQATAVSRLYYACFYAVTALLFSEGQSSAKHSGVIALFDRLWIKTGRLPRELGRFYHAMFDRRQESDYRDLLTFARTEVEAWLEEAKSFVAQVSARLREEA